MKYWMSHFHVKSMLLLCETLFSLKQIELIKESIYFTDDFIKPLTESSDVFIYKSFVWPLFKIINGWVKHFVSNWRRFFYKSRILLLIMTQLRSSCSWMYLVFWYFFLLQRRLYMLYRDFPTRIPHSSVLVIFLEARWFWVHCHWSYYSSQAAAKSFQSRNIICDCFWELACLLLSCPKFEVLWIEYL